MEEICFPTSPLLANQQERNLDSNILQPSQESQDLIQFSQKLENQPGESSCQQTDGNVEHEPSNPLEKLLAKTEQDSGRQDENDLTTQLASKNLPSQVAAKPTENRDLVSLTSPSEEELDLSRSLLPRNEQGINLDNDIPQSQDPLHSPLRLEDQSLQPNQQLDTNIISGSSNPIEDAIIQSNSDQQEESNPPTQPISENPLPQGSADPVQSQNATSNIAQQAQNPRLVNNGLIWKFLNINSLRYWTPDEAGEDIAIKGFFFYAYLGMIYTLGLLVLLNYLHVYCLASSSICFCLAMSVEPFVFPREASSNSNRNRRFQASKYFRCADWVLIGIFLLATCVRYYPVHITLTPYAAIGSFNIILSHYYAKAEISLLKKATKTKLNLCFWLQMILIGLKADGIIENWLLVFIGLFYVLIFCMAASVGITITAIPKIIQLRRIADPEYPSIGLAYILFNGPHFWTWFFLLFGLLQQLKNQDGMLMMTYACIFGLVHALALIMVAAYKVENIFVYIANSIEDLYTQPVKAVPQKFFETIKENIRYLLKISPTYFMVVTKDFKPKDKDITKQSKKQMKKIKLQPKQTVNPRKVGQICTKPIKNPLEMNSATVSFQGKLLCTTPIISQASYDLCYSDNDVDVIEEAQQLKQESDESEKNCVVCCLNTANAVFMTCGHGGVCYSCALKAWNNSDNCVFCRQPIEEVLKVNLIEKISVAKVTEGTKKRLCVED